jgi:hypothetical protein
MKIFPSFPKQLGDYGAQVGSILILGPLKYTLTIETQSSHQEVQPLDRLQPSLIWTQASRLLEKVPFKPLFILQLNDHAVKSFVLYRIDKLFIFFLNLLQSNYYSRIVLLQ